MDNLIESLMRMLGSRRGMRGLRADPNAFDPAAIASPLASPVLGAARDAANAGANIAAAAPQLATGGGLRIPQNMTPTPRGGAGQQQARPSTPNMTGAVQDALKSVQPTVPSGAEDPNSTTAPSVADQIRQYMWEERQKTKNSKEAVDRGNLTSRLNFGIGMGQIKK